MAAGRALRSESAEALRRAGITWGQARVLRVLDHAGEPMPMSDLASHLHVVPRSATDAIDGLVVAGLVERCDDPNDRRRVLVCLTAGGRRLVQRIERARSAAAEPMLEPLTPADRAELRRLLAELIGTKQERSR